MYAQPLLNSYTPFACIHSQTHARTCLPHTLTCTRLFTYTTHTHTHTHTHTPYTCTHMHTHMHTHTHTHLHTHSMHTSIHLSTLSSVTHLNTLTSLRKRLPFLVNSGSGCNFGPKIPIARQLSSTLEDWRLSTRYRPDSCVLNTLTATMQQRYFATFGRWPASTVNMEH